MYVKIINFNKNKVRRLLSKYRDLKIFIKQVMFKQIVVPSAIYIEPTNICNANCIFCAYQFYEAPKKIMSLDNLNIILEQSKDMKIKYVNLTPFAGEIFTDKHIMEKINLIGQSGFETFSTYSNLINLKKEYVSDLLNSGLTSLHISASPLDKELYQKIFRSSKYDSFIENLIFLLESFNSNKSKTVKTISIEFRSNMSLKECLELPDYKNKIKPLINANITVGAMQVFDSWMGVIKKDDLLEGMTIAKPNGKKLIPCGRLNNIQVLSNGDMRVCGCRFNNESEKDIFYIGNIKNISIKDAYNSQIVKDIKRSFILRNPPVECQKCSWYS